MNTVPTSDELFEALKNHPDLFEELVARAFNRVASPWRPLENGAVVRRRLGLGSFVGHVMFSASLGRGWDWEARDTLRANTTNSGTTSTQIEAMTAADTHLTQWGWTLIEQDHRLPAEPPLPPPEELFATLEGHPNLLFELGKIIRTRAKVAGPWVENPADPVTGPRFWARHDVRGNFIVKTYSRGNMAFWDLEEDPGHSPNHGWSDTHAESQAECDRILRALGWELL